MFPYLETQKIPKKKKKKSLVMFVKT
jgi:hypothetical protein